MKKVMTAAMILCLSLSAIGALTIQVAPQGDGVGGRERWGYGSYYNVDVDVNASPNAALHWSESGDAQSRDTYMQVAIGSLTNADAITAATLYINVLSTAGSGCDLYHAADSSAAAGDAAQKIGCNQLVSNINGVAGWVGYDVTDYIKNDVNAGYGFAAFKFAYNGYSSVTFSSAESDCAPYLSVSMVPEPATMILLGIGAVVLGRKR